MTGKRYAKKSNGNYLVNTVIRITLYILLYKFISSIISLICG